MSNSTDTQAPEQEPTGREALLEAVEACLAAQPRLDPQIASAIRAAVRVEVTTAEQRKELGAFWQGIAARHGLRAAERASGISRYHLLLAIAGLQGNAGVWGALAGNLHRGEALDASKP